MHRIILYVMSLLCLFLSKMYAQETDSFEAQTKAISDNIGKIVKQEKENLQIVSDSLNLLVQNDDISYEKAQEIKENLAQKSAERINLLVTEEEEKLVELVQNQVNTQIINSDEKKDNTSGFLRRTSLHSVWTFGYRGVRGNKEKQGIDFGIGLELKTRVFKNNSLFYIKYGLTYNSQYEYLIDPNKYYVVNGSQTDYMDYSGNLKRNSVFLNSYLRMPIALELDFSKKSVVQGKEVFRVNQGFKFSVGGYIGYNTDSRQTLRYTENGRTVSRTIRGDWNINDWEYGLMATASYKTFGVYATYGLNPVFRDNPNNERIFAIGIIFK